VAATKKHAGVLIVLMMASGVVWLIGNLPESKRGGTKPGKDGGFDVFEDCRVISDQGNDGDSFQVKMSDGKVRHLRLYFVDAPETGVKRYRDGNTNVKRLRHQADYFSGLSQREIVGVGQEAQRWVKSLLSEVKSFTVYSRGEEVYESGRIYVLIKLKRRGRERWMHELLVEEGLARIYTMGTDLPDGTSREAQTKHLHVLEKAAKAGKKGGWELARKSFRS
jgi:endonuclease YncB( thermonuclease family)